MNHFNKPSHFDVSFAGLYANSAEQTHKVGQDEHQSTYCGMHVKTLGPYFPVYHNHSNKHQNNDSLSLSSNVRFTQPTCFSGNEPKVWEPTPSRSSYANQDNQLTYFPARLSDPQNLRPVAIVNPLTLYQTTSCNHKNPAEEIAVGNSSIIDRCRKCRRELKDPAYLKYERELKRKRINDQQRNRYRNDPVYAEKRRIWQKNYCKMVRQDPTDWARKRKLSKDCAYAAKRLRECQRALSQNISNHPEGQESYTTPYNTTNRQPSDKKTASKLASISSIEQYLESAKPPGNSGELSLTSNLVVESGQNSSNHLDYTLLYFPLLRRMAEEIFTIPIEPISP